MVCPMLDAAGAPVELRADPLLTACHIRNRLPTRSLDGMSPHEAWTGQKPGVSHICKFGCLVYRHIIKKSVRVDQQVLLGVCEWRYILGRV